MVHGLVAEHGPADGVVPGTAQADQSKRLAGGDHQRDGPHAAQTQLLHLEEGFRCRQFADAALLDLPPDNHCHKRRGRRLGHVARGDLAAIAQHRHLVGDAKDLVEAMSDIDDPEAAGPQPVEDIHQAGNIRLRQSRRRLVQHQKIAAQRQGPGDGNDRLLGCRQARGHVPRGRSPYPCGERLGGGGVRRRPVDQPVPARIAGQDGDILRDRHRVDQAQVLMDEVDRQVVGARNDWAAVDEDLAGGGRVDPGQQLDQGRLAGAVLTEQRVDLATPDGEVDPVEGERRR